MPRSARLVIPDYPYHITQRGNYRQKVFEDDKDRHKYLSFIHTYSQKHQLLILAYCLMDNHVHFIVIPKKPNSLAKVFSISHMRYSQYFNRKKKTPGHLWQGRFYSCLLGESHLIAALRYVERNPVRAKIVRKPWQWTWSSAKAHTGKGNGLILLEEIHKFLDLSAKEWQDYIDNQDNEQEIRMLRKHTWTGRPLGTMEFISKLAERVGKRLTALPRERPRKKK